MGHLHALPVHHGAQADRHGREEGPPEARPARPAPGRPGQHQPDPAQLDEEGELRSAGRHLPRPREGDHRRDQRGGRQQRHHDSERGQRHRVEQRPGDEHVRQHGAGADRPPRGIGGRGARGDPPAQQGGHGQG
ncbi:MAG: hypothetical protein ACK559_00370, partial [bacterium]